MSTPLMKRCIRNGGSVMNRTLGIALVAHDGKKTALCDWARAHVATLRRHRLVATGTTGQRLLEETGLTPERLLSGPLGGDQQIGSRIVEGSIDMLVFFSDPLSSHPHAADVQALQRIAVLSGIPLALNAASADCLLAALATW